MDKKILIIPFVIIFISGFFYHFINANINILESIYNTISLFALDIRLDSKEIEKAGYSWWIYSTAIFAAIFSILSFLSLFAKKILDKFKIDRIVKNQYNLLIGLGEQNSSFLNSLNGDTSSILAIESDIENKNIDYFKEKGFGIISQKAEDTLENLKLLNLQNTIISTGDDRRNISIAIKLIDQINDTNRKKIFVRIENRDLNILFQQGIIEKKNNIEVIAYSLYENMVKDLFSKHTVLGYQSKIINTEDEYHIVLVGNSLLATEIVYQLAILSNLPNENHLTIHLVDKNAIKFYQKLKKLFTQIDKIPHLSINPLELDSESLDFYTHKIWQEKNLTNIIVATDNEDTNLDIAVNLQDTTYIKKIADESFETKVLIAMKYDLGLASTINNDNKIYRNFYTFADIAKASTAKNLIDEELDIIAKWIHGHYKDRDIKRVILDKEWLKIDPYKRASNKAQALHIDTKLIALNLKKIVSDKSFKDLEKINKKIFGQVLKDDKDDIFPDRFDSLLDKLARSEHNRWNTFHYLHGWTYNKDKKPESKQHNCLISIEEFNTLHLQETYHWDKNAVLNIPIYLARAGYQLKNYCLTMEN